MEGEGGERSGGESRQGEEGEGEARSEGEEDPVLGQGRGFGIGPDRRSPSAPVASHWQLNGGRWKASGRHSGGWGGAGAEAARRTGTSERGRGGGGGGGVEAGAGKAWVGAQRDGQGSEDTSGTTSRQVRGGWGLGEGVSCFAWERRIG